MRTLDFSGEHGAKRYSLLMDGLAGSTRGFKAPSETRIIGRVLDKLEAIGKEGSRSGASTFGLNDEMENGKLSIKFKEPEYNLMKEALEEVPWRVKGVREATEMMEWFAEAPSGSDEEEAKK